MFFLLASPLFGQSFPVQSQDIAYMLQHSAKYKTDEEIVDAMQAMLIEELFLKQMLSSELRFFEDEDDDTGIMGSSKKENEMYNMIMTKVLSKEFAKQDILQLRRYLLKSRSSISQEVHSVR